MADSTIPSRPRPRWSGRKKVLVTLLITAIVAGIVLLIFFLTKNDGSGSGSGSGKVELGFCLQNKVPKDLPDQTQLINLKPLEGKITFFWDWQEDIGEQSLKTIYNLDPGSSIEFIPMVWGIDQPTPSIKPYKYLMLSNESDMVGGCLDPNITGPCNSSNGNDATSSGYWITTGDYGCFATTPSMCEKRGDGLFDLIARRLTKLCETVPATQQIVSPAMSQYAEGPCNAFVTPDYKNHAPGPYTKNDCGGSACVCNGWLKLLRDAALNGDSNTQAWWNKKVKVISIHAYYAKAHFVKLKILHYMQVFEKDKKKIWLTETAYVNKAKQTATDDEYVKEAAEFATNLLYKTTRDENKGVNDKQCVPIDYKGDLPGFLSEDTFTFNNKTATWFGHGLERVSWFCVREWYNFDTGCNGVIKPQKITSWPYDLDHKPNAIYDALFPAEKKT